MALRIQRMDMGPERQGLPFAASTVPTGIAPDLDAAVVLIDATAPSAPRTLSRRGMLAYLMCIPPLKWLRCREDCDEGCARRLSQSDHSGGLQQQQREH